MGIRNNSIMSSVHHEKHTRREGERERDVQVQLHLQTAAAAAGLFERPPNGKGTWQTANLHFEIKARYI